MEQVEVLPGPTHAEPFSLYMHMYHFDFFA